MQVYGNFMWSMSIDSALRLVRPACTRPWCISHSLYRGAPTAVPSLLHVHVHQYRVREQDKENCNKEQPSAITNWFHVQESAGYINVLLIWSGVIIRRIPQVQFLPHIMIWVEILSMLRMHVSHSHTIRASLIPGPLPTIFIFDLLTPHCKIERGPGTFSHMICTMTYVTSIIYNT